MFWLFDRYVNRGGGGTPTMRIAVGGIHTESSTYNPVPTEAGQFRVLRGEALAADPGFAALHGHGATILPTLHARAIAGGPVRRAAYDAFRAEFLDRLRATLPVDGLYLAMHGAMFVEGMEDAEGDWIEAARAVVGPGCRIAASYDLHGNLSQRIVEAIDMFTAYRTAPHVDVEATMRRAVGMLVRSLTTGERPVVMWAPIPVVLPGERTSTVDEPARGLYARLPAASAVPGVWDASLMVGYVWADEPRATAAAVLTGIDRAAMAREAAVLAQAYWDAREAFVFGCRTGPVEACVALALASTARPVVLADSGDNPTGGGVGDRADVLARLVAHQAGGVIVAAITDRPAVDAAFAAGAGARVALTIGATLDTAGSRKLDVVADIVRVVDAPVPEDREAVVRIGGIELVLAARRRPYHHLADFARLGLDPASAAVVVVKSGYLSPELAALAGSNLMALSEGVVDQFIDRLSRHRKLRPTYPFDRDFRFVPAPSARAC